MLTEEKIRQLGERVGTLNGVRGVAVTSLEVPAPGEGDVDMMVYCAAVPPASERKALYTGEIPLFSGTRWGEGDRVMLEGVEVYVMYFTMDQAREDIATIQSGERIPWESGGFYITG